MDDDGTITLEFRKKVTVNEMIGIGKNKEKVESNDLKRGLYKWDNTL